MILTETSAILAIHQWHHHTLTPQASHSVGWVNYGNAGDGDAKYIGPSPHGRNVGFILIS